MTKQVEMVKNLDALFAFIVDEFERSALTPTIREICARFGYRSTATASSYLRKLEEQGKIKIDRNKSRAITIVHHQRAILGDFIKVPLIGEVSAGPGMFAEENYIETMHIPANMLSSTSGQLFMLKVQGTSMREIGILDGDYIIVRHQKTAENGQVIVALLEGENATVKRYFTENGRFRLHPENSAMRDIYPTSMDVLGLVVGVYRTNVK